VRGDAVQTQRSAMGHSAGTYGRALHTKAGEVTPKMPKLRRRTFETATIDRYPRRETRKTFLDWA